MNNSKKLKTILKGNKIEEPNKNIPKRTTKVSQKLKFFPEEEILLQETSDDEAYNQAFQIPETTIRKKINYISKYLKKDLPRVTSYLTANIHTKFQFSDKPSLQDNENFLENKIPEYGELFIFDYGCIVLWNFDLQQEQKVLNLLKKFEIVSLNNNDSQLDQFYFYIDNSIQPKIYNDIITLKTYTNYMIKLTISHAIAQSTKLLLYENWILNTIEETKFIPQSLSETGHVEELTKLGVSKKIGKLYAMKISVNLVSTILDTPEIFWSEPKYEPLYKAIRGYLEISQRVGLLNQRVDVIDDMLTMLKEHFNNIHTEYLDWILVGTIVAVVIVESITIVFEILNYLNDSKYS